MTQFLQYSGIVLWVLLGGWLSLHLLFGKNWPMKLGSRAVFGPGLIRSTKQLIQETKKREIKEDTVAEVAAHVLWRVTRIGMLAVLIGLIPFILLYQQNRLISKQNGLFEYQNERVEKQTAMIEQQTLLLGQQTGLLSSQDSSAKKQNVLLANQNLKIDAQNALTGRQLGLMDYQNILLDTQNYRLNLQNNLIEADRRGSLVILMSNIMDQMNEEIQKQKDYPGFNDSLGYALSDPLIGRIAALSQGFLPYRYLEKDNLSKREVSPERGQLLLVLLKSNLDSATLAKVKYSANFDFTFFNETNLSDLDLSNLRLSKATMKNVYLGEADLFKTEFNKASLISASFVEANLQKANFHSANLQHSSFVEADLRSVVMISTNLRNTLFLGADLSNALLFDADLSNTNLTNANLDGAFLIGTNLQKAKLHNANLSGASFDRANLSETDFEGVKGLDIKQLRNCRSLRNVQNLDPKILQHLKKEKPCLFARIGCE